MLSLRVDVVSDIVCPWCYIGSKRLKELLTSDVASTFANRIQVIWHPYRLMPGNFTPLKKSQFYQERFGGSDRFKKMSAHVQHEGESCEIQFNFGEDAMLGPTTDAHRLLEWVPVEKQQVLVDKLFSAYHEKGQLISDHDLLANYAAETGLDKSDVIKFLKSDEGKDTLEEKLQSSPQRYNMVGGVPHFVFTITGGLQEVKTIVSGGQPSDYFRIVLDRAIKKASQTPSI